MTWCGLLSVAGRPYKNAGHVFTSKHGFSILIDVDPICILDQNQEISVKSKDIWDRLERFKYEDHRINGWAVKVGLIRSLRKLTPADANTLKESIERAKC